MFKKNVIPLSQVPTDANKLKVVNNNKVTKKRYIFFFLNTDCNE